MMNSWTHYVVNDQEPLIHVECLCFSTRNTISSANWLKLIEWQFVTSWAHSTHWDHIETGHWDWTRDDSFAMTHGIQTLVSHGLLSSGSFKRMRHFTYANIPPPEAKVPLWVWRYAQWRTDNYVDSDLDLTITDWKIIGYRDIIHESTWLYTFYFDL